MALAAVAGFCLVLLLGDRYLDLVGNLDNTRLAVGVLCLLAVVSLLLQRWGPAVVIPVTVASDVAVISFVYRMRLRTAAVLALLHFAFAAAIGLALYNIIQFL